MKRTSRKHNPPQDREGPNYSRYHAQVALHARSTSPINLLNRPYEARRHPYKSNTLKK